MDIVLEGEEDLTNYFKGITFYNLPEGITLMSASNASLGRSKNRKFTLTDDARLFHECFSQLGATISLATVWVKKIHSFHIAFQ